MARDGEGWAEATVGGAPAGTRYRFRVDGRALVPDPASRFQPEDVHGPSEVIDADAYDWGDGAWRGLPPERLVFYELHVGTFTPEGTFAGARARLDDLAALGVTALELMPVADFPGRRGWGYDGVLPFAPRVGLRPARGPQGPGRRRPRARPRRLPRRRLQPPRARGELPRPLRPRLLQPDARDAVGRGHQLRRSGVAGGPPLRRRQRPLLARGVPPGRAPPRRHPLHRRRVAAPHRRGGGRDRCRADRPGTATSIWCWRTPPTRRAGSCPGAAGRRASTARSGTTTSTMPSTCCSRASAAGTTLTTSRPAPPSAAASPRASRSRASGRATAAACAASRAATCRRPPSWASSRTTTRWATGPSGSA